MPFLTLIYDQYNVLIRIEENETFSKAFKASMFRPINCWYKIVQPEDETERSMYYALLNM